MITLTVHLLIAHVQIVNIQLHYHTPMYLSYYTLQQSIEL